MSLFQPVHRTATHICDDTRCYVAYDAHLANHALYKRFLHNTICCYNTLFTKTNYIVNV